MGTLRGLILLLLVSPAWGYTFLVAWDNPTEDVAGNWWPSTQQQGSRVEWLPCDNGVPVAGATRDSLTVPGAVTMTEVNAPWRPYCWTVFILDVNGLEAAASNVIVYPQDTVDSDRDGIPDFRDNCTLLANPRQVDSDADGYGNRCDGDLNGNGIVNAQDVALLRGQLHKPSLSPVYNPADINANGVVNAQDVAMHRKLLAMPPGPSGLKP